MQQQNQIKRTLAQPESIDIVRSHLGERLVTSAQALGAMPGRTLSGARQGDWPAVKGYYRMIDKPDDSGLNAQAILAPHRVRTVPTHDGAGHGAVHPGRHGLELQPA